MSSNRRVLAIRTLLVLCLAASAAACATDDSGKTAAKTPPALTPTEHFAIKVTPHEDQILLAPHADALSPAQSSALQDLADRWRDVGDGVIKIETPSRGGEETYRATALIQDALFALGVRPDQVHLTDYDPGAQPRAPIIVGFTRYEAKGPQCGRDWTNFTSTMNNDVNSNFGCANTANIAALIANPADLVAPRQSQPVDAQRRETVLDKYRQGQMTSSAKDDQASGAISNVVH
jgi:pilus assembly protein CpaD